MPDPLLPNSPLEGEPELTNCDREPIHLPESIQPHGCLLAVDASSGTINAASENVEAIINDSPEQLIGRRLSDRISELTPLFERAASTSLPEGERADRAIKEGDVALRVVACWVSAVRVEPEL